MQHSSYLIPQVDHSYGALFDSTRARLPLDQKFGDHFHGDFDAKLGSTQTELTFSAADLDPLHLHAEVLAEKDDRNSCQASISSDNQDDCFLHSSGLDHVDFASSPDNQDHSRTEDIFNDHI